MKNQKVWVVKNRSVMKDYQEKNEIDEMINKIKQFKENNKLTCEEMADKLRVGTSTLSDWFNRKTRPSSVNLLKVINFLEFIGDR